MTGRSVLISGAGVAGPALAYWLHHHGHVPTIVERAPRLRTGGYVVDFWGAGYDIVERMGLAPAILEAGYRIREVRIVNESGRRVGGFSADVFRRATNDRFTSLPRGELSAILFRAVADRVETIFGDSAVALDAMPDGVLVHFERGLTRRFDLVIGADGLHSSVRRLAWGEHATDERYLGYVVAAFEIEGYRPRDEDVYVGLGMPGLQVSRFSMRGDRTMVLFVVADDAPPHMESQDRAAHEDYLRRRCAAIGWECASILEAMPRAADVYFDRVSQIRLETWARDRVALVGDAAYAPSLLAGQGSALAIVGAYVLAGELARAKAPGEAFARYERLLRPLMAKKQTAAEAFAGSFAPRTHVGVSLRNFITRALSIPFVARLAMGRTLFDRIDVPDYG